MSEQNRTYSRNIDYTKVPAEEVQRAFKNAVANQTLEPEEKEALENHLFWYAVEKATQNGLPVKLHTGYYAGENYMPLSRLLKNPGAASELPMIALAKHYTNAFIDMCWSWLVNPIAAKNF